MSLTWGQRLVRWGIVGSGALFLGGLYASYKYFEICKFEKSFREVSQNKELFFKLHDQLAINFDKTLTETEQRHGVMNFRKSILKFAQGNVIELGVGTSRNLELYPQYCNVVGVDYSPKALEVALSKNTATNIEYSLQDLEKLSFNDDSFDTVVDTYGLEFYNNPRAVLREASRVCKRGGLLLLVNQGMSENKWLSLYYRYMMPVYVMKTGYFPNRPWSKIIDDIGFEVIERKTFVNGTIHYQILKNNKPFAANSHKL